jgi:hypothetical protein
MFNVIKDIRDLALDELAEVLGSRVAEMADNFGAMVNLGLNQRNGNQIKYLLARMTAWLEALCGGALTFADLVSRDRKQPFEIEHIWANHPELHPDLLGDQAFADQRNKIGGLLLLPKDFNASYGDMPYSKKLPHYFGQNALARSLHERCYANNPTFLRLVSDFGLPFEPVMADFTAISSAKRQELYQRMCEIIWDPASYGLNIPDQVAVPRAFDKQRYYGVSLNDLLASELLRPGQAVQGARGGVVRAGTVTAGGEIALPDGRVFESPSSAAAAALGVSKCNGWWFWQTETPRGLVRLSRIREDLLERRRARS